MFLKQKNIIFIAALNPLLNKDETGSPYMADMAVPDKSYRYKHTTADIPDSWVLIYIRLPARSPVVVPISHKEDVFRIGDASSFYV